MEINLISDTVTKPSPSMLQAMISAEVGDDVFSEDPTVNALEEKAAKLFGMERAVFCPSGTMTNQIAIKVHTQALDEMVCHEYSHVYKYELGGYGFNSGIGLTLLPGKDGKITADQIEAIIKPPYEWEAITKLVVLENTANKAGGSYYTLEEIAPITKLCKDKNLRLHLDGARIFNALAETGETPQQVGKHFDSISICLSKGLGAPVGSLLIGSNDFIAQARRFRKVLGGGMRQAGFLAAAGIYALDHNVERLKEDHANARKIGVVLSTLDCVGDIRPIRTNIIIFDVKVPQTVDGFLKKLAEKGIKAVGMGGDSVRFVLHLDITQEMVEKTCEILKEI